MKTSSRLALTALCALLSVTGLRAQTFGSYTPYSLFGVGDLASSGSAYNKSMAGVGIAARNNRFLNPVNPASVTARDTLSFMADYSLIQDNKIFRQGDFKAASNTMNIGDFLISFPLIKSSAMMVGIMPFSDTGYGYSYDVTDPDLIGRTGNISYSANGQGSIYRVFLGVGVTFWRRLSLGAEADYYFGKTEKKYNLKFEDASYNGAANGQNIQLRAPGARFGLQYEQPVGAKSSIILGATYRMRTRLGGSVESYRYSSGSASSDTLYHNVFVPGKLSLASEKGVGISFNHADRLMVEFDYTRSDWRDTGMDLYEGFTGNLNAGATSSVFKTAVAESFRLGFEYVPNRNDIRYYLKRVAYRGGAYWRNEYYSLDGHAVNAYGITLGATFPVFRWHNGITFGMDFGQRGSVRDNMIRETYFNFSLGFNLFDIWFQKFAYD